MRMHTYASHAPVCSHEHHVGSYGKYADNPKLIVKHLKCPQHREKFRTRALMEAIQNRNLTAAPAMPQPATIKREDDSQATGAQPSVIAAVAGGGDGPGRSDDRDRDGSEQQALVAVPATEALVAVPKPQSSLPQLCTGIYFDQIANTPLGEMKPYLQAWLGSGRIAFKNGACHLVLFTMVSGDRLHIQCWRCFEMKCFLVRMGWSCCSECWKICKDMKICREIASQTYLILKGQILAAEAGCACLNV